MHKMLSVVLGAGAALALASASTAHAEGGCGPGFHRNPYGACRPNRGPGPLLVAPGLPAIGVFYPGRGYWDGRRYYVNRYRWHGGWRYR